MNVIYILLIFSGGEYEYMCTNICMFNFQSQVPMDQINFFKLKDNVCRYYEHNILYIFVPHTNFYLLYSNK